MGLLPGIEYIPEIGGHITFNRDTGYAIFIKEGRFENPFGNKRSQLMPSKKFQ